MIKSLSQNCDNPATSEVFQPLFRRNSGDVSVFKAFNNLIHEKHHSLVWLDARGNIRRFVCGSFGEEKGKP